MQATQSGATRQPTLPRSGGLLARGFVYRRADTTDVRLTWARARAEQGTNTPPAPVSH